ncbi:CbtA family protein [Nocardioides sp. Kera G14]|uniref:CbtA family protein n=1 Tax=Nocardioides sp. Kera G14 TaxID=2884264 RepID=UPI001D11ACE3|nr:CbtA family protein [Nocardioides sp. Kera G14]UDY25034.1 CbtA family protein [Nocardioides sp. Kera G14]
MVKQLIGRGALSGAVAGLVAFIFARIFAEPVISKAIDYESARDAAQDALDKAAGIAVPAAGPDIFSRTIQMDVGIGAGLILFGAAMGALVAVGYVVAIGRVGRVRPFQLALLVPVFYFLGVFAVPFLKYPANPPAIGHEETIRTRGTLYLVTVLVSCIALFLAVYIGQRLHARMSLYKTVLIVGAGYVVVMAILFLVLPPLGHLHANVVEYGKQDTETPLPLKDADGNLVFPGFPADLLAKFRVYSIINQVILWGGIALLFAPQAQKLLDPAGAKAGKESRFAEDHTPVAV